MIALSLTLPEFGEVGDSDYRNFRQSPCYQKHFWTKVEKLITNTPMLINAVNCIITSVSSKVTLRTVFIVLFVLQIVGAVGLVGYLSFINGQQAVNDVASQLRREISDRTSEQIKAYLRIPHLVNLTNADAIRLGQLDIKTPKTLERHFLKQIQVFDSLSRIYFSNLKGGLISAENDKKSLSVAFTENFAKGVLRVHSVDSQGKRRKLLVKQQNYDARERPFYKTAVNPGKPTWSPIYVCVPDSKGLGIAASYPFYGQAGRLQGVLSSDLSLVAISRFLQNLKIGSHGKAFIIERSGLLVASSTTESPFLSNVSGKENKRLKATESREPLISATTKHLISRFGNLNSINSSEQLDFEIEDERQFAQVTSFKDEFGLDWLIVVVVPEADFMQQINANTHRIILLCIAAFVVATGIGILTGRWISKPILCLNRAAKAIAQGEWDKAVEIKRSDEVGQLAESFNQMAAQLQESFAALRESESHLTQFLEAVPVGVTVHDATGKPTYVNQTAKQIMGIDTLPDTKTQQLAEAYQVYLSGTEQLYPTEKLPVVKALLGKSSTADDMDLHRLDRIIPLEVWATPIYDETGKVAHAIVAFAEITQRKQSQKILDDYNRTLENKVAQRTAALQESEERFRTSVENMLDCFGIYSAIRDQSGKIVDFRIEYVNEAVCTTNQTPKEQQIGKTLCELLPNHQSSGLFDEYVNVVETGNPLIKEDLIYEDVFNQQRLTRAFDIRVAKLGDGFTAAWRDISDKKRAEETLRQREQEFRALVENSPDVITRLDRDYRFRYVNPRLEVETSIPLREWIGKTELDLGFPETIVNSWHETLQHIFETGQEQFYESEFPSSSGMKYWLVRMVPEFGEDGSVETVLNASRDITARKQAETALQESEQFLRGIYEGIETAVFIVDVLEDGEFRYLGINPAHERISGLLSSEVKGKTPEQVLTPEMAQMVSARYRTCIEAGERITYEECLIIKEKESWWITNLTPVRDSNSRIYRIIGTCFNISDRKRVEEALRKSEEQNRVLLDAIPDLMIRMTKDGTYLDFWPAKNFKTIVSSSGFIGKSIYEIMPSEVSQQRMHYVEQALSTGSTQLYEFQLIKDGNIYEQEARIVVCGEDEVLVIVRDITARKQAEEALRQLTKREQEKSQTVELTLRELKHTQSQLIQAEKMSSLGQMVAGIAHEINNPVSFIYGNLTPARHYFQDLLSLIELYQQTYPHPTLQIQQLTSEIELDFLAKDWQKLIDSMQMGAERIREIVRSLRNFSRLDEKELKPVDINEGIDNTLLILQHRLRADGIRPQIQLIKDYGQLSLATCYASQLNQVFMNLLNNAIDALENQPTPRVITIRTRVVSGSEQRTTDNGQRITDFIVIRIADNGSGMNQAVRKKIFDPFFTTKPVGSGTGLGLSISYEIVVKKHKGNISCISAPGEGTEFIVEIPVRQTNAEH
jgi:PAS domain S-box-containing protein